MLKVMRKHAKYFYVLFVIVILSFIFWGVGTVDKQTVVPLAEVGKEQVGLEEYWRTYDRMSDFYREVYKERFDAKQQKDLQQKILDSLVEERLLLIAAADSGITVSEKELEESIINDKTFMRDGAFSKEIYLRALELNRMTPLYYEAAKRRELTIAKMRRLIEESVELTASDMQGLPLDDPSFEQIRQAIVEGKKQAAVKSYVEGLKKKTAIKINKDLIS